MAGIDRSTTPVSDLAIEVGGVATTALSDAKSQATAQAEAVRDQAIIAKTDTLTTKKADRIKKSGATFYNFARFIVTFWSHFPHMEDDKMFEQYLETKSIAFERIPEQIFGAVIVVPLYFTRMNFDHVGSYTWAWGLSFAFLMLGLFVVSIHFVIMAMTWVTVAASDPAIALQFKSYLDTLIRLKGSSVHLPGLIIVLSTISTAFQLIARVLVGQCPVDASVWVSQSCNPVASSNSIPHDSVLYLFSFPLIMMSFIRGGDIVYIASSYAIAAASVVASLVLVGGSLQLYTALYALVLFCVTIQVEKCNRDRFLAHLEAEEASQQRRELLTTVLPDYVIDRVIRGEPVEPTTHTQVCTFFSDVVKFTELTDAIGPFRTAELLGRLYTVMDQAAKECEEIWKVETIGDAYFCECGVVYGRGSLEANVAVILDFALLVHQRVALITNPLSGEPLSLRMGINCGECVAGLVGTQRLMPHYALFGSLINITSRLETTSNPRMIQVGSEVRDAMLHWAGDAEKQYVFEKRGKVDLKGLGMRETWWFMGTKDNLVNLAAGVTTAPYSAATAADEDDEDGESKDMDRHHPYLSFDFDVSSVKSDEEALVEAIFTLFALLFDFNAIAINPSTLRCYLRNLADHCNNAPYHNFHHAWQVTQFTAAIYFQCFLRDRRRPGAPLLKTMFASMIAATCHDVDHDGFSNLFHVNTASKLAKTFFNNSPQENHNIATASFVLSINGCNVFENWTKEFGELARSLIFNTLLATDMKNHGDIERELRSDDGNIAPEIMSAIELLSSAQTRSASASSPGTATTTAGGDAKIATTKALSRTNSFRSVASGTDSTTSTSNISPLYDLLKLSRIVVHAADIANCARPFDVCRKYAMLLHEEFAIQVRREKSLNIKVLAFMDPKNYSELCEGEAQFGRFMGKPYFTSLALVLPQCQCLVDTIVANISAWEKEAIKVP